MSQRNPFEIFSLLNNLGLSFLFQQI